MLALRYPVRLPEGFATVRTIDQPEPMLLQHNDQVWGRWAGSKPATLSH